MRLSAYQEIPTYQKFFENIDDVSAFVHNQREDESFEQITKLNLKPNSFQKIEIPSAIFRDLIELFPNLQDIEFYGFIIEDLTPLGELTHLEKIFMKDCSIDINKIVFPLSIKSISLESFYNIESDDTQIEDLSWLNRLTNLEKINIENCNIDINKIVFPSNIKSISLTNLSSLKFEQENLKQLKLLNNLDEFMIFFGDYSYSLDELNLDEIIPNLPANLKKLELEVPSYRDSDETVTLSELDANIFQGLLNLENLSLRYSNLTILPSLANCGHLKKLTLLGMEELQNLPDLPESIKELEVRNCKDFNYKNLSLKSASQKLIFSGSFFGGSFEHFFFGRPLELSSLADKLPDYPCKIEFKIHKDYLIKFCRDAKESLERLLRNTDDKILINGIDFRERLEAHATAMTASNSHATPLDVQAQSDLGRRSSTSPTPGSAGDGAPLLDIQAQQILDIQAQQILDIEAQILDIQAQILDFQAQQILDIRTQMLDIQAQMLDIQAQSDLGKRKSSSPTTGSAVDSTPLLDTKERNDLGKRKSPSPTPESARDGASRLVGGDAKKARGGV